MTAYTSLLLPCGWQRTSFTVPIAFSTGAAADPVERSISALRSDIIATSDPYSLFSLYSHISRISRGEGHEGALSASMRRSDAKPSLLVRRPKNFILIGFSGL